MRVDAKNLLDRLGRSDLSYREFEDRFSELELWPLLETLLRDPRLQGLDTASAKEAAKLEVAQDADASVQTLDSLFQRYEGDKPAIAPRKAVRNQPDVRDMLHRLSEMGAKGEL